MNFKIDIRNNILNQFSEQLKTEVIDNTLVLPPNFGNGQIALYQFPNQIEFYHLKCTVSEIVELRSTNPRNSEWLLFNINLSKSAIEKTVNNQKINFQKFLPSGILFYTRDTHVFSSNPKNSDFEIVLIRVHTDFFKEYEGDKIFKLKNSKKAIIYEDLNYAMENALMNIIKFKDNRIRANAFLMQFLADILDKLKGRELSTTYEHLHPSDVKGLFIASAYLRNPVAHTVPSVKELAEIAGMGTTKFKTTFKQVFGKAPIQYHQKIKFDYAKTELESKRKSASELSYELGYSHPSKFTSAFKKIFGTVPSTFN
ncbi:AraC family transcriptional regulator [Spongiivirga sp. MCCC 1A20706]|uniref:helix-turn-helix domain-containing protein n=1 Tax=Spongiivirga sp. MCCC 1A20706 TaxID=3160963 RepID=UPI003977CDBB